MNNKININKMRLTTRILIQVVSEMIIVIGGYIILQFIGRIFYSFFYWSGDEFIYIILNILNNNFIEITLLFLIVSTGIILIRSWFKIVNYLEQVVKATELIYNDDEKRIKLPSELNELEDQLNEIKTNVNKNKKIAKEAEQRKNDLVVYLAHDLKTPLTSVIGYLTLLRDEKQISEELRNKYLSISLDKAERLEDLVNEFFEITRFNLSNRTLEYSQINLTMMLEQIICEFEPMLKEKNLSCKINTHSNIAFKCDVDKMQRVFDNLLRNAVNYSFENSTIDITLKQINTSTIIRFKNKGNTIPQEKLNRIFEQFYRLDTARQTKSGGSGVGLAIAKQIIEAHNGTISVTSEDEIIDFKIVIPSL